MPAVSQSWSFMRLRFESEDDLRSAMWTILEENSTPMVCDERTRHSSRTKRWSRQDLCGGGEYLDTKSGRDAPTFLRRSAPAALSSRGSHTCSPAPVRVSDSPRVLRALVPTCVVVSPLRVEAMDVARFLPILLAAIVAILCR